MFKLFRRRLKGLSPTDNGNLVKAGQDHLSSAMTSKKSTLASVGKHSIKAGEKTVGINLIFLQTGTGNKLLELMKEAKLLEEEEEKVEEKTRPRLSPKDAFNIGTSQEEEEADSDFSEVGLILVIKHVMKCFQCGILLATSYYQTKLCPHKGGVEAEEQKESETGFSAASSQHSGSGWPISNIDTYIPDICQILDTTALLSPVKHTKNCLNLQQNSQKGQNRTTSRVLCAKKDTRLKKVHHHHCGGGNCEKYQLCLHTVFSTTQTFDHLVLVARPPRLTNFPSLVIMYFKLGNLTILGSLFFSVF